MEDYKLDNDFTINVKKNGKGASIFSMIEKVMKLDIFFIEGFPVEYLPKVIFVVVLGLLYIGNTHYSEKTVRNIHGIQAEVEDLRADYTTLKSDLMFASKQSEVAKKVEVLGLKESLTPPHKILIKEGEY